MLFLIAAFTALAAETDDPWTKVRELKTGTDLRIIKAGAPAPVMAKFAELTEENLIVILKNEEVAIPRDKVSRIDSHPQKGYVRTESKSTVPSDGSGAGKKVPGAAPTSSYSTGVAIGDKTDFETIYRRTPADAPKKK
jgi:hypothetical protein